MRKHSGTLQTPQERCQALPVCAEEHQALVVQVGSERLHTGDQQPQPDAKLAAIDQQRV